MWKSVIFLIEFSSVNKGRKTQGRMAVEKLRLEISSTILANKNKLEF